ncbi:MAG TPA: SDR family NAD(P)-dependent oxidoreductase, partial [Ktedonobacterales bacterium]|nr:SDR family NAD(P)-dependent oxidoreductase [Ktedonobacterales bacterium]
MSGQDFQGKVAIVTGASQGIGAATAELLAERGAQVALLARSSDLLTQVADAIVARGGVAQALLADIADQHQVTESFARVQQMYGPVDILVNAAGQIANVPFVEMDLETWDRVQQTNIRGVMLCCQAAFRQMIGRGGTIVNVS